GVSRREIVNVTELPCPQVRQWSSCIVTILAPRREPTPKKALAMTIILKLGGDPTADEQAIELAADLLRRGGLVAFPTETVYGLGANALDEVAIRSIFAAKDRPVNNPLIVHVFDAAAAQKVAAEWPEAAQRLAHQFWPGPLTLVLAKHPSLR